LGQARHRVLGTAIIGLGRLWDARHRPALLRLRHRFRIVAVHDQIGRRARQEAAQLGCLAVDGLRGLIERSDVDVVHCLSPSWSGLHAVELACRLGKPVYCGLPVANDPAGLERLAAWTDAEGRPFVPELARRFYPATLRLRELLATRLGAPRVVAGHVRISGYDRYSPPGPSTQLAPLPIMVDPGANLLDWCRFVFQAEPIAVQGFGTTVAGPASVQRTSPSPAEDFGGFVLEFPGGALAQLSLGRDQATWTGSASSALPRSGFQVYAERGVAWLEMPDRIHWSDGQESHEEHLPGEPSLGEALNEQFHRFACGTESLAPTLRDALAAARLVAAVRQSRTEGLRIALEPPAAR
jgi:predicted dehydrogenase